MEAADWKVEMGAAQLNMNWKVGCLQRGCTAEYGGQTFHNDLGCYHDSLVIWIDGTPIQVVDGHGIAYDVYMAGCH